MRTRFQGRPDLFTPPAPNAPMPTLAAPATPVSSATNGLMSPNPSPSQTPAAIPITIRTGFLG